MSFDLSSILNLLQSQSTQTSSTGKGKGPGGVDPRTRDINALKAAGASTEQLSGITDRASAESLAAELGITLQAMPEPPQGGGMPQGSIFDGQNQEMGAKPSGQPPMGPPPEILSAFQSAGISDEDLATLQSGGPQVAQQLAAKYNITLPAPPQGQHGGVNTSSTDTSGIASILQQLFGTNKV